MLGNVYRLYEHICIVSEVWRNLSHFGRQFSLKLLKASHPRWDSSNHTVFDIDYETIEIKVIAPYSIISRHDYFSGILWKVTITLSIYVFSNDLTWAIASGLPKTFVFTTGLPLLGSWTSLNENVTYIATFRYFNCKIFFTTCKKFWLLVLTHLPHCCKISML